MFEQSLSNKFTLRNTLYGEDSEENMRVDITA